MKRLILLFSVSVLLIVQHLEAQTAVTDTVFLQLYNDSVDLKEVVVKGKRTPVANSRWSDMSPVELVTVGGANGDLYQALQTLPGTQVQGESGRLLVRGGSSDETQTYIDGMHVLNPYTATGINSPARGRYSTLCSVVSIWNRAGLRWNTGVHSRLCLPAGAALAVADPVAVLRAGLARHSEVAQAVLAYPHPHLTLHALPYMVVDEVIDVLGI